MKNRFRFMAGMSLVALIVLASFFMPVFLFGTTTIGEHGLDEPGLVLSPGRQIFGLRLEYGKKLNVALTRMSLHTQYEVRLSYPASVTPPFPHVAPPIPLPAALALRCKVKSSACSYQPQYPAECTVDVRTGASSFDDSFGGSGRELLNTEKHIFNSGAETEGIAELSCDTIAVVAVSSSTPPPNHVVFNLGALQCGFGAPTAATRSFCALRAVCLVLACFIFVCFCLRTVVWGWPVYLSLFISRVKQHSLIWLAPFQRCTFFFYFYSCMPIYTLHGHHSKYFKSCSTLCLYLAGYYSHPISQDSFALIMFAALSVVAAACAALFFLPVIAASFADVSAETKE